MRAWDGVLLFWAVFWLVVGAWTGYQIYQLNGLADSTVQSGHALQTAGRALRSLGGVPVIGDRTAELGGQVASTADGIVKNGAQARVSVQRLSVLVGLAIGLSPTAPVLLFYLPMRVSRSREVREIRRTLNGDPQSRPLQAHLAQRAVANLRYAQLRTLTDDPYGDLGAGRHHALADAELARLGLRWSDSDRR